MSQQQQQQQPNITIVQKNEGCLGGCAKWVALLGILLIAVVVIGVHAVDKATERAAEIRQEQGEEPQQTAGPEQAKPEPKAANPTLEAALAYLPKNVEGLVMCKIIGNDVYMAYKDNTFPEDYKTIANAASVNGSMALVKAGEPSSRCTAWVIPADAEAGNVDKIFYTATARNGKLQQ